MRHSKVLQTSEPTSYDRLFLAVNKTHHEPTTF